MKNKLLVIAIMACVAITSSCGTLSYYSAASFDDAIYYKPTKESRAKMVADFKEQQEIEQASYTESDYDTYLAKDDDGNLYLINEYADGDSFEARLHKFDSPVYTFYVDYGPWYNPWYNPWWGSFRHPYYGYAYNSWYWGMYDPWYWGYSYSFYDPWYYGWGYPYYYNSWYRPMVPGYGPGFGPGIIDTPRKDVIYTHRTENNGSRMYKRVTEGSYAAGTNNSRTSSATYGTHRTSTNSAVYGSSNRSRTSGSYSTGKTNNVTSGSTNTRSSRSSTNYNTNSTNYNSNVSRSSHSSGSYSGGGYSGGGGGGYSGGGSSAGGSAGGGGHRR